MLSRPTHAFTDLLLAVTVVGLVLLAMTPSTRAFVVLPALPVPHQQPLAIEQVVATTATTASSFLRDSSSPLRLDSTTSSLLLGQDNVMATIAKETLTSSTTTTPAPTMKPSTPAFTLPAAAAKPAVQPAFAGNPASPPLYIPSDCAQATGFRKAAICPDLQPTAE